MHNLPIQTAQAASERRQGDGPDSESSNIRNESVQTTFYIFISGIPPPMPLGRKINDEARIEHACPLKDEHFAWRHLTRVASMAIGFVVLGKGFLELQSNTFAHVADTVDCVDQGFRVCFEKIAFGDCYHDQPLD